MELVGILYGDAPDAARDFRAELGGTWPLVDDPDGQTAVAYGITGVPETYVIDENGIIVARLIGAVGRRPSTRSSPNSHEATRPSPTATTTTTGRPRDTSVKHCAPALRDAADVAAPADSLR